jgi:hypothetical protein
MKGGKNIISDGEGENGHFAPELYAKQNTELKIKSHYNNSSFRTVLVSKYTARV